MIALLSVRIRIGIAMPATQLSMFGYTKAIHLKCKTTGWLERRTAILNGVGEPEKTSLCGLSGQMSPGEKSKIDSSPLRGG